MEQLSRDGDKKREGLESDAEVALLLFDWRVTLILPYFTQLICWPLFKYACVSFSLVSTIVVMSGLCTCMWGGDIKIRARSYWAMVVFVLVLSNINIVWQKSLSAPLKCPYYVWVMKGYFFGFWSTQQQVDMHARSKNILDFLIIYIYFYLICSTTPKGLAQRFIFPNP